MRLALVDRGARLGEGRTWSFHSSDLPESLGPVVTLLLERSWDGYEVKFPSLARVLRGGYHSISRESFEAAVRAALGDSLRLDTEAREILPEAVALAGGESLRGRCVIDAR